MTEWVVDDFMAMTLGIVVYFLGIWLNSRLAVLRRFTIPAPVSGGLLTALAMLGFYLVTGISVSFEMETRDLLLLYFFSAIGLNAKVSEPRRRPTSLSFSRIIWDMGIWVVMARPR